MRKDLLIIALGLSTLAGSAAAEVLATPDQPATPTVELPRKGTSMADVKKKFGEPSMKHATVGGETPKHPPITRWDYAEFSAVFERDKLIDAVVPGKHPAVYHKEQLKPTEAPAEQPAEKPAETSAAQPAVPAAVQPAVPAEPPVMKTTKTTEQPIVPLEKPATAKEMQKPKSEEAAIPAEPAAAAPAPAAASPEAPVPAAAPATANPVPETPPTPK